MKAYTLKYTRDLVNTIIYVRDTDPTSAANALINLTNDHNNGDYNDQKVNTKIWESSKINQGIVSFCRLSTTLQKGEDKCMLSIYFLKKH